MLEKARKRNKEKGVTGLIIETRDHFIQILEGEEKHISETFQRIKQNPLHQHLRIVYHKGVSNREFSEWTMGYATDLDAQQISDADHLLNDFATKSDFTEMDGSSLKMLLSGLKSIAN